jgi:hypothetical protein
MTRNFLLHALALRAVALALALAALPFAAPAQNRVQPPPLPPGSSMVRVAPGMNPQEVDRQVRAHHHKAHVRKDLTRDAGTLSQQPPPVMASAPAAQGGAPVVSAHFGNADQPGASRPGAAKHRKTAAERKAGKPVAVPSGSSKSSQIKSGS